jgi:hypothetical protein
MSQAPRHIPKIHLKNTIISFSSSSMCSLYFWQVSKNVWCGISVKHITCLTQTKPP